MASRFARLLVVTALVLATGLHWIALQSVAWTTMLASHLCNESFSSAVCKTFDGQHPCCLCKAIAAAKKSEKKSDAVSPLLKMEFPPLTGRIALIPPTQFQLLPLQNHFADSLSLRPPAPPPRRFPI